MAVACARFLGATNGGETAKRDVTFNWNHSA